MAVSPSTSSSVEPIVLFDGTCGLCSASVRWLSKRDGGRLRYAPLQGATTAGLRRRVVGIPDDVSAVALVDGGRVFVASQAFLRVARYLSWPWRAAYWLRWLPSWLLDPGYRLMARVRYRLWGRVERCEISDPTQQARLLP